MGVLLWKKKTGDKFSTLSHPAMAALFLVQKTPNTQRRKGLTHIGLRSLLKNNDHVHVITFKALHGTMCFLENFYLDRYTKQWSLPFTGLWQLCFWPGFAGHLYYPRENELRLLSFSVYLRYTTCETGSNFPITRFLRTACVITVFLLRLISMTSKLLLLPECLIIFKNVLISFNINIISLRCECFQ